MPSLASAHCLKFCGPLRNNMNRKNLFLWSLYDFANSFVYISFLLYFAQWLVVDAGLSDFWYNAIFALTTVVLLFTAPLLASSVDAYGGGKKFLAWATLGSVVAYALTGLLAALGTQYMLAAAIVFGVGQYFYQLSFVFYTPLLLDFADEAHRGRASGIGQSANALGQVLGVLAALPFASTHTGPLLPSVALFAFFALPMLVFFKEKRPRLLSAPLIRESRGALRKFLMFISTSAATGFLVSYFFFNDAIITLSNNYAIVLERIFDVSDLTKSLLLLSILVASALGGIAAGFVVDAVGAFKTLVGLIIGWIVMLPVLSISTTFPVFAALTSVTGLLIGSSYSTARVYLMSLLRPEEMTYGFSLFTLFERFASLAGPLAWGLTLASFGSNIVGYRAAIVAMAGLMAVGLAVLLFTRPRVRTS